MGPRSVLAALVCSGVAFVGCASDSGTEIQARSGAPNDLSPSTPEVIRAVETTLLRDGNLRLDVVGANEVANVTAADAVTAALPTGYTPVSVPEVLLTRVTIADYGELDESGVVQPLISDRLSLVIIMRNETLDRAGSAVSKAAPKVDLYAVVDALTGELLTTQVVTPLPK